MRAFLLLPAIVITVQLRHLVDLDRGFWRMLDVDIDNAGAEHWRNTGHHKQYNYCSFEEPSLFLQHQLTN